MRATETNEKRRWIGGIVPCFCLLSIGCLVTQTQPQPPEVVRDAEWPISGGNPENTHYSPLQQINRDNVSKLEEAWTFDTEEKGGLETTPLIVDGVLYAYTPTQQVFALDAASGKPLWRFNSGVVGTRPARAVVYWKSGDDTRILAGVMNFVYRAGCKDRKADPELRQEWPDRSPGGSRARCGNAVDCADQPRRHL